MGSNSDLSIPVLPVHQIDKADVINGVDDVMDRIAPIHVRDNAARVFDSFIPSSYSANKSATTTVTGQSEAIATGATRLRITNLDATNYGLVAFGTSAANAETNAANGVAVEAGSKETIGIPALATHYAWLGNTGTVTLNIIQGV
jgi:hypothetical protein